MVTANPHSDAVRQGRAALSAQAWRPYSCPGDSKKKRGTIPTAIVGTPEPCRGGSVHLASVEVAT